MTSIEAVRALRSTGSWPLPESDDILEAEGEDERAPDTPQRRRVERSDVFQKAVFGDRLNVVELYVGFLRQISLVAKRNFCGISLPDRADFRDGQLVHMGNDSLPGDDERRPPTGTSAQIQLPYVAPIHFLPQV